MWTKNAQPFVRFALLLATNAMIFYVTRVTAAKAAQNARKIHRLHCVLFVPSRKKRATDIRV
jgi:hypothetical protein